MFLHVSVILFTCGGSASVHAGIQPPTGTRNPGTRHPLRDQAPCTVHAGRYGQQAGGMHPTGMQSCLKSVYTKRKRM